MKKPLSQSTVFNALAARVTTAEADIVALNAGGGGTSGGTAGAAVTISANANDLAVGTEELIPLSNTTGAIKNVTGIAGGTAGTIKRLVGAGDSAILLVGESASSTAGNRFAASATLMPGEVITLVYSSGSRWEIYR